MYVAMRLGRLPSGSAALLNDEKGTQRSRLAHAGHISENDSLMATQNRFCFKMLIRSDHTEM